jgi:hypothetical protein
VYPIDIRVNNVCVVRGASYGDISGPITAPAATFTFKISVANSESPCSNKPIFSATAGLSAGTVYLGVITLDASNHILGQIYPIDLSPITAGEGRFVVANATQQNLTANLSTLAGAGIGGLNVPASSLQEGFAVSGLYTTTIYLDVTNTVETGPAIVGVASRNVYIYILAGSANNNSVQLFGPKILRGVF